MSDESNGAIQRYDQTHLGRILQKAIELQEQGGSAASRPEGLTLAEIEDVAAEVGVSAPYVRRAAALVRISSGERVSRYYGAPVRLRHEATVGQQLRVEQLAAMGDAIGRVLGRHGEMREVFGALEWHRRDDLGSIRVSVVPGDGQTHLVAEADRKPAADLMVAFVPASGAIVGGILAGVLHVGGAAATIATVVAGGVAGIGIQRWWLRRMAARWRARLGALVDRLGQHLQS